MTPEIGKVEKIKSIASRCKNVNFMDSMVERYQKSTKSAVENILNMCVAVSEISSRHKAKEINDFDMTYFCSQVGLEKKSPTFRKFRQIGDHADRFYKHMNTLPSAYTVLFQITTLDPDKFEQMIKNEQITPSLSLEKLKQIIDPSVNTSSPDDVTFKVEFNMQQLSNESKDFLKRTLMDLMTYKDIETVIPKKHQSILSYGNNLIKSN
jgi:hypothetical protein